MGLNLDWLKHAARYAMLTAGGAWEALAYAWMVVDNVIADENNVNDSAVRSLESQINPTAPRTLIYGERRVGGTVTYAKKTAVPAELFNPVSTGGQSTAFLLVYTIAGHECQQIGSMYFNDQTKSYTAHPGAYQCSIASDYADTISPFALYKAHSGSGTVTENDWLDAMVTFSGGDWTYAHKQEGCSKVLLALRAGSNAYSAGVPQINWLVQGKKVYDSRTSTTAYSANPALCIRDFLLDTVFGPGCDSSEIDTTSFETAANVCDESADTSSGTETRYTCNAVFTSDQTPDEILRELLSSCGGILTYQGGKYHLYAGAYRTPTLTFTEDDFIAPLRIGTRLPRTEACNGVRGTFAESVTGALADYPQVQDSAALAEDQGDELWLESAYPATISSSTAQRLARILLMSRRKQIRVNSRMSLTALQFQVGDVIQITIDRLGWATKDFLAVGWTIVQGQDGSLGVDVELHETANTVYDWQASYDSVMADNPATSLPAANSVDAPSQPVVVETLYETIGSRGVGAKATVTWTTQDDTAYTHILEYKLSTDTDYTVLSPVSDTSRIIYDLAPATYNFRVKSVNNLGGYSDYSTVTTFEIIGLSAAPADVNNLYMEMSGGETRLRWDKTTDLDVQIGGQIVIRHSTSTSGATWMTSVEIARYQGGLTEGLVPRLSGTYLAKFVDSTGHFSDSAAVVVTNIANVENWNGVVTVTESTAWGGAFTNCYVDSDGNLTIDCDDLIDSRTDVIDDWGLIDSLGGVQSSGTYDFASNIDLGAIYASRVTVAMTAAQFDTGDLIDNRTDSIDSWDDIDGTEINDCNARVFVRTSTDGASWSEWGPVVQGEYKARYYDLQVRLTSGDPTHNIDVQSLAVAVDMRERTEQGAGVSCDAAGTAITFSQAFKDTPAVGITMQDGNTGDYIRVTLISSTGFTVRCYTSGGAGVARTIDWIAKGYGYLTT